MRSVDNFKTFDKFLKVLKKPCPIKEKFARANHAPYMTKPLRK